MKKLITLTITVAALTACTTNAPTALDITTAPAMEQDSASASTVNCTITAVVTPFNGNNHYVQVTGNHVYKGALVDVYGKTTQSTVWSYYASYSPFTYVDYWNPGGNTAVYEQIEVRWRSNGQVACSASLYIGPGLP